MSYFKHFQKVPYDLYGTGVYTDMVNLTEFTDIAASVKYLDNTTYYSNYNIIDGERPDTVSYKLYDSTEYYWTFFIINDRLKNLYRDWPKTNEQLIEYCENKYSNYIGVSAVLANEFDWVHGKFKIGETIRGSVSGALGKLVTKYPTLSQLEIEPISGTFLKSGEGLYGLESQDFITAQTVIKKAYAPKYYVDAITNEIVNRRIAAVKEITYFADEYNQNLEKSKIRVIKPKYISEVANEFAKQMKKKTR